MVKKAKPGLGKGLDLLIPKSEPVEEKKTTDPQVLKISQVEPNRNQPRKQFDKESLQELAGSIKQYGIIQPIIVAKKDDYYEIIAGERRWRAAKMAGLKEVPVVIKEYSEKEIAEISLIENIQRENLNPIEEAKAYKSLIEEYNLTQEELSERISKSRTQITNTMRLLKLHDKVQKMLIDGSISAGHARALLGLEIQEEQLLTAQKIVAENLSVRQTEDLVRQINNPPKSKKSSPKIKNSVFYKDLEKRMTEALGTKVKINQKEQGKGRIEISYFSEDELDRIFTIINSSI
ncbi:MAG: ParB/RepB/Spo0J family partition protein [Parasporobacterium sp.]|nr:ParB/RepB/Spo0J family partition protein [Parasporobacterium sp.]